MKVVIEKEKGVFGVNAEGVKSKKDIQELRKQLEIIERQLCEGAGAMSEDVFCVGKLFAPHSRQEFTVKINK